MGKKKNQSHFVLYIAGAFWGGRIVWWWDWMAAPKANI
jgi:hypothetical protein